MDSRPGPEKPSASMAMHAQSPHERVSTLPITLNPHPNSSNAHQAYAS